MGILGRRAIILKIEIVVLTSLIVGGERLVRYIKTWGIEKNIILSMILN